MGRADAAPGCERYVPQGGDWGAIVSKAMAHEPPPGLLGIHTNMPATVPAEIPTILGDGDPAPAGLSHAEPAAFATEIRAAFRSLR